MTFVQRLFPLSLISSIIIINILILYLPSYAASIFVPVDDEVYDILIRLESEGIIKSSLLTTKPLSRKEVLRLLYAAEANSYDRSPALKKEIKKLTARFKDETYYTKYFKPLDNVKLDYVYSDENPSDIIYNNDGDNYDKGSNYRLNISSRADFSRISFFINPELRYHSNDTDINIKKFYGVLYFLGIDFELGKDSQFWGPGYNGSILLSNNAEPFTLFKISHPHPVLLPWIFRYLGLFKFTLFTTILEEDRDVSDPFLLGIRLNIKPLSYFEIGLQKTTIFGGEGQSEKFEDWMESIFSMGKDDQRIGIDLKLTIPFKWQPLQIYAETAAEDGSRSYIDEWVYLAGIYLPRILDFDRIGFRAEYANTYLGDDKNLNDFYSSSTYTSGYTYKDNIIGHHMGNDSEDMFFMMNFRIPELNSILRLSYDKVRNNLSNDIKSSKTDMSVEMKVHVKEEMTIEGKYTSGELENIDSIEGNNKKINLFMARLKYIF